MSVFPTNNQLVRDLGRIFSGARLEVFSDQEVARIHAERIERRNIKGPSALSRAFNLVTSPFSLSFKIMDRALGGELRVATHLVDEHLNNPIAKFFTGIEDSAVQIRRFCNDICNRIFNDQLNSISDQDLKTFMMLVNNKDDAANFLSGENMRRYNQGELKDLLEKPKLEPVDSLEHS